MTSSARLKPDICVRACARAQPVIKETHQKRGKEEEKKRRKKRKKKEKLVA